MYTVHNFATLTETPSCYEVYDNVLNEKIVSLNKGQFYTANSKTLLNNILAFISDLEEISYRARSLMLKFLNNKLSAIRYMVNSKSMYDEIGIKFCEYFQINDMDTVYDIVSKIYKNSRQDDCAYSHFIENATAYISKKEKQQKYFDSFDQTKTFEAAINNYITSTK